MNPVELTILYWVLAGTIAVFAGIVKGATGFAMPMIMISGLGTFLAPDLALAGLILPTVATNLLQALRGGIAATLAAMRDHWIYLAIVLTLIALSAQLVQLFSDRVLFLLLGVPVTFFATLQLIGWRPKILPGMRRRVEVAVAVVAGFLGGLSGIWGPPTVMYLTALETPKKAQVAVQGVVYGSGAVVLLIAHVQSGLFNLDSGRFSAILLVPALIGLAIGFRIQDSLDQDRFRKITLVVLTIAGLNLIRRGLAF